MLWCRNVGRGKSLTSALNKCVWHEGKYCSCVPYNVCYNANKRKRKRERDKTEGNSELILIYIKSTSTILIFNLPWFHNNTMKKHLCHDLLSIHILYCIIELFSYYKEHFRNNIDINKLQKLIEFIYCAGFFVKFINYLVVKW